MTLGMASGNVGIEVDQLDCARHLGLVDVGQTMRPEGL